MGKEYFQEIDQEVKRRAEKFARYVINIR